MLRYTAPLPTCTGDSKRVSVQTPQPDDVTIERADGTVLATIGAGHVGVCDLYAVSDDVNSWHVCGSAGAVSLADGIAVVMPPRRAVPQGEAN